MIKQIGRILSINFVVSSYDARKSRCVHRKLNTRSWPIKETETDWGDIGSSLSSLFSHQSMKINQFYRY